MTDKDPLKFDDTLLENELVYPDWFKLSLGDLNDDVAEAREQGKFGIAVYYGQKRCAYCEKFFEINLTDSVTERELALRYDTNFTPSLVFYDRKGKPVFRLRGYYPPYQFRASLHYVVEGFYRVEKFRNYLERAEPDLFFTSGDLIERDFFLQPPYDLQRDGQSSNRALAVIFEQGNCHACELLHSGPLTQDEILGEIAKLDVVQLNLFGDTEVVTPDGKKTTAKQWGQNLGLFYTPTIVLFNPRGHEIMRVDSVVQFYRLWGVLDYVNKGIYDRGIDYQGWRLQQRETIE